MQDLSMAQLIPQFPFLLKCYTTYSTHCFSFRETVPVSHVFSSIPIHIINVLHVEIIIFVKSFDNLSQSFRVIFIFACVNEGVVTRYPIIYFWRTKINWYYTCRISYTNTPVSIYRTVAKCSDCWNNYTIEFY